MSKDARSTVQKFCDRVADLAIFNTNWFHVLKRMAETGDVARSGLVVFYIFGILEGVRNYRQHVDEYRRVFTNEGHDIPATMLAFVDDYCRYALELLDFIDRPTAELIATHRTQWAHANMEGFHDQGPYTLFIRDGAVVRERAGSWSKHLDLLDEAKKKRPIIEAINEVAAKFDSRPTMLWAQINTLLTPDVADVFEEFSRGVRVVGMPHDAKRERQMNAIIMFYIHLREVTAYYTKTLPDFNSNPNLRTGFANDPNSFLYD